MTPGPQDIPYTQPASVTAGGFSEDGLVEQPTIALFADLGWQTANLYYETLGATGLEGRLGRREVFLPSRLKTALKALNPDTPEDGLAQAYEALTRDRSTMIREEASQDVYQLLKDGFRAAVRDQHGVTRHEIIRFIDWRSPTANDFFLASQMWVASDMYTKRPDLIGFVNGIPLVLVELKAAHVPVQDAYNDNLKDYRDTIPHLLVPNAFVILSNGSETLLGSTYAPLEYFVEWKRISDEEEAGVVSLETVVRGTCHKARLLDLIENFITYETARNGLIKMLAKNHQFLGVNKAIEEVKRLDENRGKLGVFWHTQGSGKSLSMLFLTQKVHRTVPGNWTFVIVTDRQELDQQIYRTFAANGAVTETAEPHAESRDHLRQLLTENHRYVFTLIQKFSTGDPTEQFPELSDRRDIIVITDEAHRSQYDVLAMNMRKALPNAAFIGFTGTPLISGEEERTREVFGDYVSVYNFAQSIEDRATVPLYYENRIPELQLTNEDLDEDLDKLLEDAQLTPEQEEKVEREFAREYHLITRDDRLERVAEDIVSHFLGRSYKGKAMVICIDKATAVRMYDKVQARWIKRLEEARKRLTATTDPDQRVAIEAEIAELAGTDMAVVVSQSQNEIDSLRRKGLDITRHRQRMVNEDLDERFKNPADPFRLVFVCAMWITGFDVPSCSTIYLDKPMRGHTLMQTIARANRVAPGKVAGLIVDYVGIFRSLEKALAIYAKPSDDGPDRPIEDKKELVELLRQALGEALGFCADLEVDLEAIKATEGLPRIAAMKAATEKLLNDDQTKLAFLQHASRTAKVYKAILPDPSAGEFLGDVVVLSVLAKRVRALMPAVDITEIMRDVEELLDQSIASQGYLIRAAVEGVDERIDLSKINFDVLADRFKGTKEKRSELEKLRAALAGKIEAMVKANRSRIDFLERFQRLIAEYNAGSLNIEETYRQLLKLAESLTEEERRGVAENLTEEELALFDILTKPEPELTEKERQAVKGVCKELLEVLKGELLVLQWRTHPQSRAQVRKFVEVELDKLPETYSKDIYDRKCDLAFQYVYDTFPGPGSANAAV
jgi:type I restriction enzyme R subunit